MRALTCRLRLFCRFHGTPPSLTPYLICPPLLTPAIFPPGHDKVVDGNRISSLPDEIGAMQKLEKLSLKGNRLATLNPRVGQCTALQFLTVSQVGGWLG